MKTYRSLITRKLSPLMAAAALALTLAVPLPATAQSVQNPAKIEIYVTPFYNSKGPKIEAGEYTNGLLSTDEKTFAATIAKMRADWLKLPFTSMYIAAVRLYDLGYRDDAVYWFYSAQYRGRLFGGVVDRPKAEAAGIGNPGFELIHAHQSFFQLSGPYINGYAFRDPAALAGLLRKIQKENSTQLPDFKTAHPNVEFLNEAQWTATNQKVNQGMGQLIEMLQKDRDSIKAQRQSNGTEDKFSKLTSKELPAPQ